MISATHLRFNTGNVFPLFVTLSVIKSVSLGAGLAAPGTLISRTLPHAASPSWTEDPWLQPCRVLHVC